MDEFLANITKHFGLEGELQILGGECDLNYLAQDKQNAVIVKIMREGCDLDFVEMQIAAIAHARKQANKLPLPEIIAPPVIWPAPQGETRIIWVQRALSGRPMGDLPPQSCVFLTKLGQAAGQLNLALQDFDHPLLERENKWHLAKSSWIETYLHKAAPERQGLLRDICVRYRNILPRLHHLPFQAIHNDLNDWNILLHVLPNEAPSLTGIIDFGDMCRAPIICDLAIASAYALMRQDNIEQALAALVSGFHSACPLSALELELLWPLIQMRLAVSVVNAAIESEKTPGELYVTISERTAWDILEDKQLDETRLLARLRHACNLPLTPSVPAITTWLQQQKGKFHPILTDDLDDCPIVDLSVETCLWPQNPLVPTPLENLTHAGCDAEIAIGRYSEPRLGYSQDFVDDFLTLPKRTTLSMGLDIFAPAGRLLQAPLDGIISSLTQNHHVLELIFQHDTQVGTFFSRWLHLAQTKKQLKIGEKIVAGETFAQIADPTQNGGWLPHISIQISFITLPTSAWQRSCCLDEFAFYQACFPNPAVLLNMSAEKYSFREKIQDEVLAYRQHHFASNLKLSYQKPVMFVRGWKHYLFDEWGRPFLDAYNNVPHVGHAHPRIRRIACEQLARMNSNTRYLHPAQKAFAEKLIAKMPANSGLEVCFFVNSGSEANELALRLSRAATGGYDMITPNHGYHGNTTGAIDISAYKFNKPGMEGRKPWVHLVDVADDYRGRFRADREQDKCGALYAALIDEALAEIKQNEGKLAGFICETYPSVGGQIIPPDGYLEDVYQRIRAAGGICIADEVQTGLGRLGKHYFAFETQNVVPDIVVLGKPLGNGHPLAALITTREIAHCFAKGAEYFSTFGGSTLSCLMGKEVLDIVDDEGLAQNAQLMGKRLLDGLHQLQNRHQAIGQIRGLGLFIGVDLVEDRQSRQPATDLARHLINRLREKHILIGCEGPADNILKIRPPLTIDAPAINRICHSLDEALEELS